MWVVLDAFPGTDVDLGTVTFIYSLSTVAGALAMMPGGLGITEGGMTGLVVLLLPAVRPGVATATTILVRFATLWFAVLVGLVALAALGRGRGDPAGEAPR